MLVEKSIEENIGNLKTGERPWFALCVKSRNEKKVALQLDKMGVTVYCPLVIEMRQWSDRKKKIETPLINSYLFVQIEDKNREKVFEVAGVVRYLFWLGKPAVIKNEEINVLKNWLKTEVQDVQVESLQRGDLMNIPNGPFKGKQGVVEEINKNRLQLLLLELGMKITITKQKN